MQGTTTGNRPGTLGQDPATPHEAPMPGTIHDSDTRSDPMNSTAQKRGAEYGAAAGAAIDDARDTAAGELAALREKVETLMSDRVTPALADAAGRAGEAAQGAVDAVRRQTGHLADTVREQPIAAVGAAALAGLAIGLMMRR